MLTKLEVQNAKPGAASRKLPDGNGLYLLVQPNGSKLWRFDFRHGGKRKTMAFGAYPTITIVDARRQLEEAKSDIRAGIDPSQKKKLEKLVKTTASANTFGLISAELLDKKTREGLAPATLEKQKWLYSLVAKDLDHRPIGDISTPEILALLKKVEARGKLESAKRLRAVTGEVFRYAIQTGRASSDPTAALKGALLAPKVRHRSAITEPAAVGQLLRAIDSYPSRDIRAALQLMALCFPRPTELRAAQWSEFDLTAATWTIPAVRAKMRRDHKMPLANQAVHILKDLHSFTSHSKFVFPSNRDRGRCISEAAMNAALRRLGYSSEEMQPHGFRSIASTLLNESGKFSIDAIERALAHQDTDAVRRAYARGAYWDERVTMAQWWADYLDGLRAATPLREVVQVPRDHG